MVRVEQFEDKKNQFEIQTDDGSYLQSYRTVVAYVPNHSFDRTVLDPAWECSRTTMKYVNHFLGMTAREIRRDIEAGEIKVANLNLDL